MTWSLRFSIVAASLLLAGSASASEMQIQPSFPQVTGGEDVMECGWPTTVAVTGGGGLCTGSLIHPQVVSYAAHCGDQNKRVIFGEANSGAGVAYTRNTERCLANPEYMGVSDQARDWAFCILDEPVTEIPFTPPLYGCEVDLLVEGAPVIIAGFGDSSETGGAGTKRWGATSIVSTFGNTANIGTNGTSTCQGDSGGAALMQMADGSWRSISMVSTGIDCGSAGVHSLLHGAIPWIEEQSGIDVTPCHDQDGTWNPTPNCDGFFSGSEMGSGNWTNWCDGTARSAPADTCGDPFDAQRDAEPPAVAISSPTQGEEFESGSLITIQVDATDDAFGVKEVWIEIGGMEQPVRDQVPPYVFADVPFPDGVWEIVAHAEDWDGKMGSSEPITIGVNAEVPDDSGGDDSGSTTDEGGTEPGTTDASTSGPGTTSTTGPSNATDDPVEDEDGDTDSGAANDGGGDDGCGCRARGETPMWSWLALGLLVFARRRRTHVRD